MNLGERCDEIVRLIDETLAGLVVDADAGDTPRDPRGPAATVTPLPITRRRGGVVRPGAPDAPTHSGRAAAGF